MLFHSAAGFVHTTEPGWPVLVLFCGAQGINHAGFQRTRVGSHDGAGMTPGYVVITHPCPSGGRAWRESEAQLLDAGRARRESEVFE